MIHRVLYVSRVATPHLRSAVEDILIASVRNNARDGITGFLVCDGAFFAQALEGPADRVEACFQRIAADPRNQDVVVRLFCRRLLGYALGRAVTLSDTALLDEMVAELNKNGGKVSAAVQAIVRSPQFRMVRGSEAGE